jgi:dTDP-4-amino-4,6-dideoxygalactose transaminase
MGSAEGDCPVAEALYHKYVSLPIHPRIVGRDGAVRGDSIRALV